MAGLLLNPQSPNSLNYGVFIRPSSASDSEPPGADRMVGILGVPGASSAPGIAEVGYVYDESVWGQGYATEALAAYMEVYWNYAKEVDYMVGNVDPENIPSIKVLKKCGFVAVDYLVKNIVLPALGMRDTIVFRIERPRLI